MKYEARPIQKNKETLKSDDYEHLVEMAKTALIQDPSIQGYLIMEHVATLTTQVSVDVEHHNDVDKGKSNEVESLFDPKPDDIPEPPEGFVYYGKKPIPDSSLHIRKEIAFLETLGGPPRWVVGAHGLATETHYAISALSLTFSRAKEQAAKNKTKQES